MKETILHQDAFLVFKEVSLRFSMPEGDVIALNKLSFEIKEGECFGIVGESGSGKSQLMLALLGLLEPNAVLEGDIIYKGQNLRDLSKEEMRHFRQWVMRIVFQDPMTSLNPFLRVSDQLIEAIPSNDAKENTYKRCIDVLKAVQIFDAKRILEAFPHELSGGLRQRVLIAMALLGKPELLIADEATTALDVTVQKEILSLLDNLKDTFKMTLIVISHDLSVISTLCNRALVLKKGNLIELNDIKTLFNKPKNIYTKSLLESMPRFSLEPCKQDMGVENHTSLFSVKEVSKEYVLSDGFLAPKTYLKAVDCVSLELKKGQSLGIVGESGCGKSTLAFMLSGLLKPTKGEICYQGQNIQNMTSQAYKQFQRDVQFIFQDPQAALNPRLTVFECIKEPLVLYEPNLSRESYKERIVSLLEEVGLSSTMLNRYPFSLSGGQCQRIGIARALICQPKVLICDEIVSALDVSVQAQVLELLETLKVRFSLSLFFISHDLRVVSQLCSEVLVMYKGRVVESGLTHHVFSDPKDAYSQKLLRAIL